MANLFAQNTANWNAASQWNTVANGSGSFVTPGVGDVCMANGKTVTININVTVGEVRVDTTGGATTGGAFTLSNGITLTANVYGGTVACVTYAGTTGNTGTITGNVTGGTASNAHGVSMTGNGTITINGNVTGGSSSSSAHGLNLAAAAGAATVNVNGVCTGATGNGVSSSATGMHTIVGSVNSGTAGSGINIGGTGATFSISGGIASTGTGIGVTISGLNMTGSISGDMTPTVGVGVSISTSAVGAGGIAITGAALGGTANGSNALACSHSSGVVTLTGSCTARTGYGATLTGGGTLNVVGNVYGSATTGQSHGVRNQSSGTINITGDCTGGAASNATYGATNDAAGTMNVYGVAIGAPSNSGAPGVQNTSTGTCYVQTARSNNYPNDGITLGALGTLQTSASGWITVDSLEFGSGGWPPISGRHFVRDAGTNYVNMRRSNAGAVTTMGEVANDYPTAANVRYGTVYDFGGMTGTCRVPGASSVLSGVAVDATTGTVTIAAADIRAAIGLASANLDTQIAAVVAKTDLIPADPASTTNITAGTITTVTNLTNAPTAGDLTAAMIASVTAAASAATPVVTVMGLDPSMLDVAVSTRLAAADVVQPDNEGIADIKAKTDALPADPASASGTMAANVTQVTGIPITGTGTPTDPWGP